MIWKTKLKKISYETEENNKREKILRGRKVQNLKN